MPILSGGGSGGSGYTVAAYTQITAGVNVTATTEGTADTILTGTAVNFDGASQYLLIFYADNYRPDNSAAARQITFWLYLDGASVGEMGTTISPQAGAANMFTPLFLSRRVSPSAGSHTYSIRSSVNAGTGTVSAGAGGAGLTSPAYLLVTKLA